ncbi:hypothetical protein ACFQY7_01140 [Actinomadura luteofluorescens]|uniref:hypothetical protein n=1 Tax=Actinomadura luteofluorescens TaxID=46163 RepID=UPI003636D22F
MGTRVFGEPVERREDGRLLTGRGRYLDDLGRDALAAAFVRSPTRTRGSSTSTCRRRSTSRASSPSTPGRTCPGRSATRCRSSSRTPR